MNLPVQIKSLTTNEFILLIDEVIQNENIDNGTTICYEYFSKTICGFIQTRSLEESYKDLKVITHCIKCLKKKNKFDSYLFMDCLVEGFSDLPLEVVWWLYKNEIISLVEYCAKYPNSNLTEPKFLASYLINLLKNDSRHEILTSSEIVSDIISELIRGCYRPNVSVYRLDVSAVWVNFCTLTIDELVGQTLAVIFEEKEESVVNFLALVQNSRNYLPTNITQRFFLNVLKRLITHNPNELDLYSAYIYQQLWCSKLIGANLCLMYREIFRKHCTFKDVLKIIDGDEVNWKFTLAAVGVCAQTTCGPMEIKDAALELINSSFKGGKTNDLIKAILITRQGCMEEKMSFTYASWYSSTFGRKLNFKTTYIATLFKFLMKTLTSLIPFESELYLQIHLDSIIAPPAKCNYLIHDYKDLCKARLQELGNSSKITLNTIPFNVVMVIEEIIRIDKVNYALEVIKNKNCKEMLQVINVEVLHQKTIYRKALVVLKRNGFLLESCTD